MPPDDDPLLQPTDVQLRLGEEPMPWKEVLSQLQIFGRLRPFLEELVSQKLVLEEIRSRTDLELDPIELDGVILAFRREKDLEEDEAFRQWLAREQLDYPTFRMRMYLRAKIERLQQRIAEPELEPEFERQRAALEALELAYVVCAEEERAQALAERLRAQATTLEALEADPAAHDGVSVRRPATPLRLGWLSEELRQALEGAEAGTLVGPVRQGEEWLLVRLERRTPAELDEGLRSRLSRQLFQRWLQRKLTSFPVAVVPAPSA